MVHSGDHGSIEITMTGGAGIDRACKHLRGGTAAQLLHGLGLGNGVGLRQNKRHVEKLPQLGGLAVLPAKLELDGIDGILHPLTNR